MTQTAFNHLPYAEKLRIITFEAVDLETKEKKFHHVRLMQFENIYIEVFFDKRTAEIANIRSFTNTIELWDYLEKIDISCLFS